MLLIAYDVKSKNRNYGPLFSAIKASGTHWWHYITNCWLVYTDKSTKEVADKLLRHLDREKDNLLVVEIKDSAQGWLDPEAWDWIEDKEF